MRLIRVCALDPLHRKPRINSQLVAQQVAQQYPMPPPPKKERRERSERTDKERPDGEGERPNSEGRPEGERPERVQRPEGDTPEKDKSDKEQPIKDKPDREKEISPAITKKPSSKKTRSVCRCGSWTLLSVTLGVSCVIGVVFTAVYLLSPLQTQIGQPPEPTQRQTQHTVWQISNQDQQELSHFQVCSSLCCSACLWQKHTIHTFTSTTTQRSFTLHSASEKTSNDSQMISYTKHPLSLYIHLF